MKRAGTIPKRWANCSSSGGAIVSSRRNMAALTAISVQVATAGLRAGMVSRIGIMGQSQIDTTAGRIGSLSQADGSPARVNQAPDLLVIDRSHGGHILLAKGRQGGRGGVIARLDRRLRPGNRAAHGVEHEDPA